MQITPLLHSQAPYSRGLGKTNASILIVDNEDFILVGLADYFRSLGYSVDCTRDADQASELLEKVVYQLVIAGCG
jgi:DNA-binding response OmpR family regulator